MRYRWNAATSVIPKRLMSHATWDIVGYPDILLLLFELLLTCVRHYTDPGFATTSIRGNLKDKENRAKSLWRVSVR